MKLLLFLITGAAASLSAEPCDDCGQVITPMATLRDDLKEAQVILIRHAYSQFNHLKQETVSAYGHHSHEVSQIISDPAYFDPGLHEIGVQQALAR